jgi:hypothetical protein
LKFYLLMPVFHITFFAYPAIFEAQHNKKTWVTFIVPFYSHIRSIMALYD